MSHFSAVPEIFLTPLRVLVWLDSTPNSSRNSNLVSNVPSTHHGVAWLFSGAKQFLFQLQSNWNLERRGLEGRGEYLLKEEVSSDQETKTFPNNTERQMYNLWSCVKALILVTLWCQFASWTLIDSLCKLNIKSLHSTFTAELGIFHRVFSATLVTEFWQLFSCTAFSLTTRSNLSKGLVCSPSWRDWCVIKCRWRAVTVDTQIIKQRRAWVSHCNMSGNDKSICQSVTFGGKIQRSST